MTVGWMRVGLRLAGCRSLKEKRHLIRPLVETLRRDFGCSVAEVGDQDQWGNAEIGLACVSASGVLVEAALERALRYLDEQPVEVFTVERGIDAI